MNRTARIAKAETSRWPYAGIAALSLIGAITVGQTLGDAVSNTEVPTGAQTGAEAAVPAADGSITPPADVPPRVFSFDAGDNLTVAARELAATPGEVDETRDALIAANGGSETVDVDEAAVFDPDSGEAAITSDADLADKGAQGVLDTQHDTATMEQPTYNG